MPVHYYMRISGGKNEINFDFCDTEGQKAWNLVGKVLEIFKCSGTNN